MYRTRPALPTKDYSSEAGSAALRLARKIWTRAYVHYLKDGRVAEDAREARYRRTHARSQRSISSRGDYFRGRRLYFCLLRCGYYSRAASIWYIVYTIGGGGGGGGGGVQPSHTSEVGQSVIGRAWASPTLVTSTRHFLCIYVYIIGASLSEPHTNGTSAARVCYMYVLLSLSIVRRAIIQCSLLFCVHNSTFQHAMYVRARGTWPIGRGRPTFDIPYT